MNLYNFVTCYNNEDEVIEYAKKISNQTGFRKKNLIVSVNSLDSYSIDKFRIELDSINGLEIYLIDLEKNYGYLGGILRGFETYNINKKVDSKWILISNTDIIFEKNDIIYDLLHGEYNEDIVWIAPSIYNKNKGSYDNPKYKTRIPKSKMYFTLLIHRSPLLSNLYLKLAIKRARKVKGKMQDSQFAYALQGCFFAIRLDFLTTILSDNYDNLMYSEENYIAEMVLKNNLKAYYNSSVLVTHDEQSTTSKLSKNKRSKYLANSIAYIIKKFYN